MTEPEPHKSAAEFVETMLFSAFEADLLTQEDINHRELREAHSHAAVNGFVAATALRTLQLHAPEAAEALAEELDHVFTVGDVGGPVYRMATREGHDPDEWRVRFEERAARRRGPAVADADRQVALAPPF